MLCLLLAALLAVIAAPAQTQPTYTCTVTSGADSGPGTLRDALARPLDCLRGIFFDNDYTIHLATPLRLQSYGTYIDGAGHSIVLSGDNNNDGVGDVQIMQAYGTVILQNLIFSRGNCGSTCMAATFTIRSIPNRR